MSFISRLLRDDVAVSKELATDAHQLTDELQRFFDSYSVKQKILRAITHGEAVYGHLYNLQQALKDELLLIEEGEQNEKEIIADLKFMSREAYVKRVDALENELTHITSKDTYTAHLLGELHDILLAEARKTKRLLNGDMNPGVIQTLSDLLFLEKHLVEKLCNLEDFAPLFEGLQLGAARRRDVQHYEKRLERQITARMQNIELVDGKAVSTDDHYLSKLTARIFNKLEKMIVRAVAERVLLEHREVDKEYVRSSYFDQFVQQEIHMDKNTGKLVPSARTTSMFIEQFRKMYTEVTQSAAST
ncbi:MAG: hypothetical protein OXR66_03205 [Candidatus Woesearchaeota archaeon]|nr:hypothetical protein [Candidatus Woesearchaeota archaeon]